MKTKILMLVFALIYVICQAASLTDDQKVTIGNNTTFQDRAYIILLEKAHYWKGQTINNTPNRSDVNRRLQKRVRLSKQILGSSWAETNKVLVARYWISQYDTSNPALDGNGLPTSAAISADFDPTYDYFAGVLAGDDTATDIEW